MKTAITKHGMVLAAIIGFSFMAQYSFAQNKWDKREDVRDAKHNGGVKDRLEDVRDKREDVRDRREDVRDRREDKRDRKENRRDRKH